MKGLRKVRWCGLGADKRPCFAFSSCVVSAVAACGTQVGVLRLPLDSVRSTCSELDSDAFSQKDRFSATAHAHVSLKSGVPFSAKEKRKQIQK